MSCKIYDSVGVTGATLCNYTSLSLDFASTTSVQAAVQERRRLLQSPPLDFGSTTLVQAVVRQRRRLPPSPLLDSGSTTLVQEAMRNVLYVTSLPASALSMAPFPAPAMMNIWIIISRPCRIAHVLRCSACCDYSYVCRERRGHINMCLA